jgi:hypothetical protein
VLALVLAIAGLSTPAPSGATTSERLERATAEIDRLRDAIEDQVVDLVRARERLGTADARADRASAALGVLMSRRTSVKASLDRATEEYEAAADRLNELAVSTYMNVPASQDAVLFDVALGATSFADLGDRLTYAQAATAESVRVAEEVRVARHALEGRAAELEELVDRQAALLGTLSEATREHEAAAAAEAAALTSLESARDRAIEVVGTLRAQLRREALAALGDALHGADNTTYGAWALGFLRMMELPTCRSNLVVLVAWQAAEGTQAAYNPLATTHRMPGSTDFNSVGVQNFVSLAQGLQATRETLENGWDIYGYGAIVGSLGACAEPMTTGQAINASRWCYGCAGGTYVIGVIPKVDEDLESYAAI